MDRSRDRVATWFVSLCSLLGEQLISHGVVLDELQRVFGADDGDAAAAAVLRAVPHGRCAECAPAGPSHGTRAPGQRR